MQPGWGQAQPAAPSLPKGISLQPAPELLPSHAARRLLPRREPEDRGRQGSTRGRCGRRRCPDPGSARRRGAGRGGEAACQSHPRPREPLGRPLPASSASLCAAVEPAAARGPLLPGRCSSRARSSRLPAGPRGRRPPPPPLPPPPPPPRACTWPGCSSCWPSPPAPTPRGGECGAGPGWAARGAVGAAPLTCAAQPGSVPPHSRVPAWERAPGQGPRWERGRAVLRPLRAARWCMAEGSTTGGRGERFDSDQLGFCNQKKKMFLSSWLPCALRAFSVLPRPLLPFPTGLAVKEDFSLRGRRSTDMQQVLGMARRAGEGRATHGQEGFWL